MEAPAPQAIEVSSKNLGVEEDEQDKALNECDLNLQINGLLGVAAVLAAMTAPKAGLISCAVRMCVGVRW
ncbi:hypothetical protein SDJN02_04080 [Cucurbita argyrosperma subsp. argyrosperma]|nr:hypothetical protein SDJN02_04080 [Cucurbita argyrosperma subsp. argyrosperma]